MPPHGCRLRWQKELAGAVKVKTTEERMTLIVQMDPSSSSETLIVKNPFLAIFCGRGCHRRGKRKQEAMLTLKMEAGPRVKDCDPWKLGKSKETTLPGGPGEESSLIYMPLTTGQGSLFKTVC